MARPSFPAEPVTSVFVTACRFLSRAQPPRPPSPPNQISDDESDCHPNIEKETWFRLKVCWSLLARVRCRSLAGFR